MTIGYICKRCATPSPTGIGYVSNAQGAGTASAGLTTCSCGYSVTKVEGE